MVNLALNPNAFENARAIHSNISDASLRSIKSDDLFEVKSYKLELSPLSKKRQGREFVCLSSINPVINGCLNYALNHLDKYKNQAIEIIKFGIKHNERVKENICGCSEPVTLDEIGGLRKIRNNDVVDIVIKVNSKDIKDNDINLLLKDLQTFNDLYWG